MAPKEDFKELSYKRQKEKKTHASFPELKYPSMRDDGMKDAVQWLTGKAMDDNAEGLWRVHNKIYDLSDFIKKHPGGAEWLELTKGLDITELYECHHLSAHTDKVLEKYFVRDTIAPRNSPFTFENDGFYRTLKREVIEELKTIPKHVAKNADMIIDGLFTTLLLTSAVSCWASNYWVVMMSYLVASLSLGWLTIAAHNYIHRRTNWRMYYFNLSMWSYRDFRVSHVLSHHVFPNTLMDMEVNFIEPLVFWNPIKDKPFHAKYLAFPLECAVFPFAFLTSFLKRFICNFVYEDFFRKHYNWHDAICFALPLWMCIISGCTIGHAIITWLWIVCTASMILCTIGFNAAHHHPDIFQDGDEPRDTSLDWALHQLEAVMDRKDINGNLFKVMTFFGDHALHHLFPTLDHAILPYLYPVFLKNVEKFRGNFRVTSSLDLFLGQIRAAMKTEPTLLRDIE